ncbi:MAG: DNA polymerase III subunit beta [Chloroflexota bacterium]
MEITVQRLRSVLEILAPAVPKRTSLPVTLNVRLGEGIAVATNLETSITVRLPETEGEAPLLLPHRKALEYLKNVPGATRLTLSKEGTKVLLQAGLTRLSLDSGPLEEFPPLPEKNLEGKAEVDGDALVGALEEMAPYTASEQSRPVLTGVCLTLGEQAEVCASDGFRLAYRQLPFPIPELDSSAGKNQTLIVPRETVKALGYLWRKAGKKPATPPDGLLVQMVLARRPIRMQYSRTFMELAFGDVSLVTRLVEGSFPNYHQLIPTEYSSQVTVMAEAMAQALRQVGQVAGSDIIRLKWEDGKLILSAREEEVGEAEVMVWAETSGEPGHIAFKREYLAEYLRGKYQTVTIQTNGGSAPGLFTAPGAPQVVVMPMFVQWDGGPAPEGATPGEEEVGAVDAEEGDREEPEVEKDMEAVAVAPEPKPEDGPEVEQPQEEKPKSRRGRKCSG